MAEGAESSTASTSKFSDILEKAKEKAANKKKGNAFNSSYEKFKFYKKQAGRKGPGSTYLMKYIATMKSCNTKLAKDYQHIRVQRNIQEQRIRALEENIAENMMENNGLKASTNKLMSENIKLKELVAEQAKVLEHLHLSIKNMPLSFTEMELKRQSLSIEKRKSSSVGIKRRSLDQYNKRKSLRKTMTLQPAGYAIELSTINETSTVASPLTPRNSGNNDDLLNTGVILPEGQEDEEDFQEQNSLTVCSNEENVEVGARDEEAASCDNEDGDDGAEDQEIDDFNFSIESDSQVELLDLTGDQLEREEEVPENGAVDEEKVGENKIEEKEVGENKIEEKEVSEKKKEDKEEKCDTEETNTSIVGDIPEINCAKSISEAIKNTSLESSFFTKPRRASRKPKRATSTFKSDDSNVNKRRRKTVSFDGYREDNLSSTSSSVEKSKTSERANDDIALASSSDSTATSAAATAHEKRGDDSKLKSSKKKKASRKAEVAHTKDEAEAKSSENELNITTNTMASRKSGRRRFPPPVYDEFIYDSHDDDDDDVIEQQAPPPRSPLLDLANTSGDEKVAACNETFIVDSDVAAARPTSPSLPPPSAPAPQVAEAPKKKTSAPRRKTTETKATTKKKLVVAKNRKKPTPATSEARRTTFDFDSFDSFLVDDVANKKRIELNSLASGDKKSVEESSSLLPPSKTVKQQSSTKSAVGTSSSSSAKSRAPDTPVVTSLGASSVSARSSRTRKVVSYAEPSLNKKLRRGDKTADATFYESRSPTEDRKRKKKIASKKKP